MKSVDCKASRYGGFSIYKEQSWIVECWDSDRLIKAVRMISATVVKWLKLVMQVFSPRDHTWIHWKGRCWQTRNDIQKEMKVFERNDITFHDVLQMFVFQLIDAIYLYIYLFNSSLISHFILFLFLSYANELPNHGIGVSSSLSPQQMIERRTFNKFISHSIKFICKPFFQ